MSDRPHPFDVLSRFVAQLSDLNANPDPDAKLVITRDVASWLGWELALALIHAGYRDGVATRSRARLGMAGLVALCLPPAARTVTKRQMPSAWNSETLRP